MLQIKDLSQEIGEDVLAKSAHILEQTILMENWLGSENLVGGNVFGGVGEHNVMVPARRTR